MDPNTVNKKEADQIMDKGTSDALAFLAIGKAQPPGTPLHEEMRHAAIDALQWANDDEIIDAICAIDEDE